MCGKHIIFLKIAQDIGMPLFLGLRELKCQAEVHVVDEFLNWELKAGFLWQQNLCSFHSPVLYYDFKER